MGKNPRKTFHKALKDAPLNQLIGEVISRLPDTLEASIDDSVKVAVNPSGKGTTSIENQEVILDRSSPDTQKNLNPVEDEHLEKKLRKKVKKLKERVKKLKKSNSSGKDFEEKRKRLEKKLRKLRKRLKKLKKGKSPGKNFLKKLEKKLKKLAKELKRLAQGTANSKYTDNGDADSERNKGFYKFKFAFVLLSFIMPVILTLGNNYIFPNKLMGLQEGYNLWSTMTSQLTPHSPSPTASVRRSSPK